METRQAPVGGQGRPVGKAIGMVDGVKQYQLRRIAALRRNMQIGN